MRRVIQTGFIVEGLGVLSLGCLSDIPVETASRQKECKCVQCEAETRGVNLGVSDMQLGFKTPE